MSFAFLKTKKYLIASSLFVLVGVFTAAFITFTNNYNPLESKFSDNVLEKNSDSSESNLVKLVEETNFKPVSEELVLSEETESGENNIQTTPQKPQNVGGTQPSPIPTPTNTPIPQQPNPSSCPIQTLNCVPCNAGESSCRTMPGASTGFKGWACQNNNPGNIRYSSFRANLITQYGGEAPCGDRGGYMAFKYYSSGRNGLKAYIKAINAGAHSAYSGCGNCSIRFFFSKYAPAGDQNDPNSYSSKVASWVGVDPDTTTINWIVANKLEEFVDAIKRMEGFFTY